MSPADASPAATDTARLLEEVSDLRLRVRGRHREHALWAALVGLVALGGAAAFLLAPQIRDVSCQQFDAGVVCSQGGRSFSLWWYWPLAASAAVAFALVRRHRRGTWRMTPMAWLIATLVLIFVVPTVVSLLAAFAPPVSYPLAAAVVLGALAMRRGSAVGIVAALAAAAGVLFVEYGLTSFAATGEPQQVLLNDNVGLALSSLLVGLAALLTAGVWAATKRR